MKTNKMKINEEKVKKSSGCCCFNGCDEDLNCPPLSKKADKNKLKPKVEK